MMRRRGRRRGGRSQWTMALVPLIVPLLGIMESENRKRGVAKIVIVYILAGVGNESRYSVKKN